VGSPSLVSLSEAIVADELVQHTQATATFLFFDAGNWYASSLALGESHTVNKSN
jgi:hypothetical protein